MLTTLVTSAKVGNDVVYNVTKALFENLDQFRSAHPSFATLTKQSMRQGLTAPLHDGAKRYFREAGLAQ